MLVFDRYFWTILNIRSTHCILTVLESNALAVIEPLGAVIISFGATWHQDGLDKNIGGTFEVLMTAGEFSMTSALWVELDMFDEENELFILFVFMDGADLVCLGGDLVLFLIGIMVLSGRPMFVDWLGIFVFLTVDWCRVSTV